MSTFVINPAKKHNRCDNCDGKGFLVRVDTVTINGEERVLTKYSACRLCNGLGSTTQSEDDDESRLED